MKTKIYRITLLLFALALFASCRNEAIDSGNLYGIWVLDSIDIDGETDADYQHDITWAMMNNVICIKQTSPYCEVKEYWGTFSRTDDGKQLTLDFSHPNEPLSRLPESMHLPTKGKFVFEVITDTPKDLTLRTHNPTTTQTITYHLFLLK